ncbi:MAG TPA: hypothetical protein VGE00_07390 [Gammaproteobacteria bacterium]
MRMKNNRLLLGLSAALMGLVFTTPEAQATPAFARQMEMNCLSCHTQAITTLNSFGRQFKLSGFSMTKGGKSMITGGDLGMSLPLAINAGAGVKSNYVSYSEDNVARDNLSTPAGTAIMIGGKVAENAGAHTLWSGDGVVHMQTTFTQPLGAGRAGLSIFGSQGHGPFIATESYNTGLHKELSIFDNGKNTNAAQATGLGMGPASGLTAFYGGYGLTVTGGLWAKGFNTTFNNQGLDVDGSHSSLYRVSYDLPMLAGWEFSLGAFGLNGSTTGTPNKLFENTGAQFLTTPWASQLTTFHTKAHGFDLQTLGSLAGMQSQLAVMHVGNWEYKMTDYLTGAARGPAQDAKATSVEGRLMVVPKFGVSAGYMSYSNNPISGVAVTAPGYKTRTLGLLYNYADNVRFSVEQSNIDSDAASAATYKVTMLQAIIVL